MSRREKPDHVANIAAMLGLGSLFLGCFGLTLFQVMETPPLKLSIGQSVGLLFGGMGCLWFANVRNKKLTAAGRLGIVDGYGDKALAYLEMLLGAMFIGSAILTWTVMARDWMTREEPIHPNDAGMMAAVFAILAGGGALAYRQGMKSIKSIDEAVEEEQEDGPKELKDAGTMETIAEVLKVLELGPHATPQQIEEAYRSLAKVWHPDRFMDDKKLRAMAEGRLKQINLAYERLKKLSTSAKEIFRVTEHDTLLPTEVGGRSPESSSEPAKLNIIHLKAIVALSIAMVMFSLWAGLSGDLNLEWIGRAASIPYALYGAFIYWVVSRHSSGVGSISTKLIATGCAALAGVSWVLKEEIAFSELYLVWVAVAIVVGGIASQALRLLSKGAVEERPDVRSPKMDAVEWKPMGEAYYTPLQHFTRLLTLVSGLLGFGAMFLAVLLEADPRTSLLASMSVYCMAVGFIGSIVYGCVYGYRSLDYVGPRTLTGRPVARKPTSISPQGSDGRQRS